MTEVKELRGTLLAIVAANFSWNNTGNTTTLTTRSNTLYGCILALLSCSIRLANLRQVVLWASCGQKVRTGQVSSRLLRWVQMIGHKKQRIITPVSNKALLPLTRQLIGARCRKLVNRTTAKGSNTGRTNRCTRPHTASFVPRSLSAAGEFSRYAACAQRDSGIELPKENRGKP